MPKPDLHRIDTTVKTYVASHVHIALGVIFLLGVIAGHFV